MKESGQRIVEAEEAVKEVELRAQKDLRRAQK